MIILNSFFNCLGCSFYCEHKSQTNGKPSETAFFLLHTAIVYTAAEERRLSTVLFKAFTSQKLCSNSFLVWHFKVTRQLLELALTCMVLENLRMRLKTIVFPFRHKKLDFTPIFSTSLLGILQKEKIATKFMKLNLLLLEKSITYGMVTYSTKEAGI